MIRYAEKKDFAVLAPYEHGIRAEELKNSIAGKRILMLFHQETFSGWLRFGFFWDNTPFLNLLYILEAYRGQGYGGQLLACWEAEMQKQQYPYVLTSTLSNERAQFFYRKNGYTDCGALLLPGEPLEIILRKDLSP